MKKSQAWRPSGRREPVPAAVHVHLGAERAEGVEVRVEPATADHVAAGRRHVGAAAAGEQRPGEQERGADALGPAAVHVRVAQRRRPGARPRCRRATRPSRRGSRSSSSIASTSLMRGMLRSTTSSPREERTRRGPAERRSCCRRGSTVPARGVPPSMMNFSMLRPVREPTRIPCPRMARPTRDEAWELVCEWTESESLRKHMLGVEAAMRAYARSFGEDEELWGATGLLHDLDYERYPDLGTGHPREALKLFEEKGYPRELIDAVAGHATFLGVPRETRMAKTLYAVDELSGFIAACALRAPRRRARHDAQVREEEAEAAELRRRREPRRGARGRRGARRGLRRARGVRDRGDGGARGRAGPGPARPRGGARSVLARREHAFVSDRSTPTSTRSTRP